MSKETREHISCLMDGEISRETSRFLVRRLGTDEELSATWTRYHVMRDCLRNQDSGFAREDLCSRVNHALENENLQAAPRGVASRWLKPVAGMAIAASVALMAVMAVDPGSSPALQAPGGVAESGSVESFTSPQGLSPTPVSSQAVSSQRMDSYLLRHYQATGANGGRSFVALVPVMVKSQASASDQAAETETENDAEDTINTPDAQ